MDRSDIREVRSKDWASLRDLRLRALRDSPDAFGSTYKREVSIGEESDWQWWIAGTPGVSMARTFAIEREGVLIGMATGMIEDADPGAAHLFGMWVEPAFRGQGLGEALLSAVVDWASSNGCDAMTLRVVEGNNRASNLYSRAGFVVTLAEPEPLREGSAISTLTMSRQLRVGS